jgi:hypothetical protein
MNQNTILDSETGMTVGDVEEYGRALFHYRDGILVTLQAMYADQARMAASPHVQQEHIDTYLATFFPLSVLELKDKLAATPSLETIINARKEAENQSNGES